MHLVLKTLLLTACSAAVTQLPSYISQRATESRTAPFRLLIHHCFIAAAMPAGPGRAVDDPSAASSCQAA